jgi:hypothetical protein
MVSRLPSNRTGIVVASLALCSAVASVPGFLSAASRLPPPAFHLSRAALTPPEGQQVPPPSVPPRVTQPSRDTARATGGTAVIRGVVYAGDTGTPLRRARVTWSSDGRSSTDSGTPRVVINEW